MSKIEVNQISSQCGSTLTIGQSGDTVTLACGATQTGFGRTGTVDWDTTAKTASFTAVSGNGYFVNTTSGAVTVTLPATPSAGDIVAINDYARTFATNNVTVGRNGSNIQGIATDALISTNGQSTTFVYVDGTQGWMPTEDQTTRNYGAQYIIATGGTVTCCGDYKIHTFTGPGTFTVTCAGNPAGSSTVDYLVVAGGGAGGGGYVGGGGGAGGYRESSGAASGCYATSPLGSCVSALPVTATGYPITVGSGGAGNSAGGATDSTSGSNSIFSTITSTGGGFGKQDQANPAIPGTGSPGGSAGGGNGGTCVPANNGIGGTGNTPPVSPPQGTNGGNGIVLPPSHAGGGGGGATAAGVNASGGNGGGGGTDATTSISGTPTAYAGGGGGSSRVGIKGAASPGGTGGAGGTAPGGGGPTVASAGTTNRGGGGGGADNGTAGGAGGSGVVIIRYRYQ